MTIRTLLDLLLLIVLGCILYRENNPVCKHRFSSPIDKDGNQYCERCGEKKHTHNWAEHTVIDRHNFGCVTAKIYIQKCSHENCGCMQKFIVSD